MRKTIDFLKTNPVLLLDGLKYVLAGLLVFGVTVPSQLDSILGGLAVVLLSIITRSQVVPNATHAAAVAEALATPAPGHQLDAP